MSTVADPVLLLGLVGSVIIPTAIFLYSANRNMKREHLAKQDKFDVKLNELERLYSTLDNTVTRVKIKTEQLEGDQKKLETAVEVKLDRFQDKLEKIYDILVQGLSKGG